MHSAKPCNAVVFSVIFGLLSGCASVTAVPVNSNPNARGIPIYAPKSLVLVTADGPTVVTVPDCSKPYVLQINTAFAKQHVVVDMKDGVVTKIDADQDATAVPLELLKVLNGVLGPQPGEPTGGPPQRSAPEIGVFDLSCQGDRLVSKSLLIQEGLIKVIQPVQTEAADTSSAKVPQTEDKKPEKPDEKPIRK